MPRIGEKHIGLAGGNVQIMPVYPVVLAVHDLPSHTLEVVASAGESWVLLGRDVLNSHRLLLIGPELALEIG